MIEDDFDLAAKLADIDRPSPLTEGEAERIRARMMGALDSKISDENFGDADTGIHADRESGEVAWLPLGSEKIDSDTMSGGRYSLVLSAVAVLLVLAVTIGLLSQRGGLETTPTDPVTSVPAVSCPVDLAPLVDAIEAWGGVDAWAQADDTDPDVGALVAEVLTALSPLDVRADGARQRLAGELAENPGARRQEAAAVNSGLDATIVILEGLVGPEDPCDLERLNSVR